MAPRTGISFGGYVTAERRFGGYVTAERRFGDLVFPSRVSVGWWFGPAGFTSFFEAEVLDAVPVD
jgi:hypothetical protein